MGINEELSIPVDRRAVAVITAIEQISEINVNDEISRDDLKEKYSIITDKFNEISDQLRSEIIIYRALKDKNFREDERALRDAIDNLNRTIERFKRAARLELYPIYKSIDDSAAIVVTTKKRNNLIFDHVNKWLPVFNATTSFMFNLLKLTSA